MTLSLQNVDCFVQHISTLPFKSNFNVINMSVLLSGYRSDMGSLSLKGAMFSVSQLLYCKMGTTSLKGLLRILPAGHCSSVWCALSELQMSGCRPHLACLLIMHTTVCIYFEDLHISGRLLGYSIPSLTFSLSFSASLFLSKYLCLYFLTNPCWTVNQ